MRKFLEKRVLPVIAAICLLVTMVSVAMSFASATDYTGKDVVLQINVGDKANVKENGYHLTLNTDTVYKGDRIKNNGRYCDAWRLG